MARRSARDWIDAGRRLNGLKIEIVIEDNESAPKEVARTIRSLR
jgi:hypothetical protein